VIMPEGDDAERRFVIVAPIIGMAPAGGLT
jgi:hypothetical protein